MPQIALVEDDRATSDKHRDVLDSIAGVTVSQAFTYEEAVRLISKGGFDLLVVDIDLGGPVAGEYRGFDILRDFGDKITTIIVTGMPEENLHALALKLKAYEFINKPVGSFDLINKAKHALGFDHRVPEGQVVFPKDLRLDPNRPPHVMWKNRSVDLTLTQLTIVHHLAQHAGKTVELQKLTNVGASHIVAVRKKFLLVDKNFDRIESDPGLGYYWKTDN